MKKKFIVYSPSYLQDSGGIIALHKLCHVLNQLGEEAYLYPMVPSFEVNHRNLEELGMYMRAICEGANPANFRTHPELPSRVLPPQAKFVVPDDFVVVYPEITFGNPLQAKNVVRWLLHNPGFHSGKVYFGPNELYFRFGSYFGDFRYPGSHTSDKFLRITHIPVALFHAPPDGNRSGVAYCIRKGKNRVIREDLADAILIDDKSHEEIAGIFKSVKTFVSYDTHTLFSRLAAIAGCDSVVVPLDGVTKDQWLPDPADRYGIAYGFDDLDYARRTRQQLIEATMQEEQRTRRSAQEFVEAVNTHFSESGQASARAAAQRPPGPTVPERALQPWLPEHRWSPGEHSWAQQTMQAWGEDEDWTIALGLLGHDPVTAAATEASIDGQWYPARTLRIAGEPEQLIEQANTALVDSRSRWVGVMEAKDRLAPDALFRLVHALRANPQWQLVYTDEDQITLAGEHVNPHFKPDFNLDYLRSLPYVGGLLLLRRELFEALGGFDAEHEGAEDYDLLLRAWEHLQAHGVGEAAIGHVPEVLYHRMVGSGHTRKNVPEVLVAGQRALQAHFERLNIDAQVQPGPFPPSWRVRWPAPQTPPLVSILVPTRDQLPMLQRCIESVIEKTRYPAYEILVVDNDSRADDALRYLAAIDARADELGGRLRVIRAPGEFNFSAMNNLAARSARGEYLLLLNNDTAALHDDWLDEMVAHAVRPDVGVVGAKLLFPDGKIQHAGVILGVRGPAEHPFLGRSAQDRGYFGRAQLVQDLSAVTGACLLVRKSVFEQLGGLDEQAFKVSYNDIDLCLRVRAAGLRVVFTPFALLMHEGSASQKGKVEEKPDEVKQRRFAAERESMYDKWLPLLARDPAYNRHLSLVTTEFQIDDQAPLAWDPEWRPRPRVLVHPADREGCGEYRIIAPMRALNRAGLTQGWETMRLFQAPEMQRIDADSLVVQRQMEWPQIEALERHARHVRAFRVFEIDDLITNLPVKSVHRAHIHKDIAKRFRKAAGLCNRLVVATEPLAQAYAGFSDEVVVCPNYIERARWGELRPARAERKRPRVGWAGGVGHSGDLELIVDVVRQTAATVDWIFFGMCPPALRDVVREFHPGIPLDQYAPKLAALDLDLAVAPLEPNAFNEAKSHLRLLEYGVLGYPVICSDITPYQGDFPVTRVPNRFREWTRAILDAVAEPQALRAQGDALRDKVLAHWMLEDHLDDWLRAWIR